MTRHEQIPPLARPTDWPDAKELGDRIARLLGLTDQRKPPRAPEPAEAL